MVTKLSRNVTPPPNRKKWYKADNLSGFLEKYRNNKMCLYLDIRNLGRLYVFYP